MRPALFPVCGAHGFGVPVRYCVVCEWVAETREYTVNVWQPNMQDDDKPVQKVTLGADDNGKSSFSVKTLKPDRRKPTPSNPFYNSSSGG